MNRELMKLLAEAGDKRKKAAATISQAAIEMAKHVEALKTASKAYATAASQLVTAYRAAHEMTDEELKDFKQLHDYIEDTVSQLQKQTEYAALNVTELSKLASDLRKDVPIERIPMEPHPERPLVPAPPIPKPNFSSEEWGLMSKPGVNAVVAELNKMAWKAIDKLDDELPHMDTKSDIYRHMSLVFEKYLRPVLKAYATNYSLRGAGGRFVLFQQVVARMNDWARKLTGDETLNWSPPPPEKAPKELPGMKAHMVFIGQPKPSASR